ALVEGQLITCAVTSSDLCAFPATGMSNGIKVHVGTGVKSINAFNDFTLIPNPTKGTFTISGTLKNRLDNNVNIVITDMLGQTIYKDAVLADNGNLNTLVTLPGSLANGMYLVSLTSGEDHMVFHVILDK